MKLKQFIFAFVAVLSCFAFSANAQNVAKISDTEYATLTAAIKDAAAGQTITLIDDVNESVSVTKNVTIDGAGKQYTGTMSVTAGVVTVKNVKFYNAGISKSGAQGTGVYTIKKCEFDGADKSFGYAVNFAGNTGTLTIEECSVKNYGYGFLQVGSSLAVHSVKNVTVDNCNYGVKMASTNTTNLEGFVVTNTVYPVYIQSNAARTVNMTNCSITKLRDYDATHIGTSLTCWSGTSKVTFNFYGTNVFDKALPETSNFTYKAAAKVGNTFCGTVADAARVAKSGETIVLLKDYTGEAIELPAGVKLDANGFNADNIVFDARTSETGTWGGIDWTLYEDGELVIAPTKGEPVADKNAPTKRTYEVGEWREAVKYNSKGEGVDVAGWPYDRSKVTKLTIKEGVTKIGSFTAQGFTNLTGEVVIPSTVTYIGQEAFMKSTMTKLTFAEGGNEELCIAHGAFKNLVIEEVALPADRPTMHIHAWLFNNCHNLKYATLPANITSMHGTNHREYENGFEVHANPTWTKSSEIFAYNENMKTITFGSEEVKNIFFAIDNGTSKDYTVATVGLVAYCDLQDAIDAAKPGDVINIIKGNKNVPTDAIVVDKAVTINGNGKTFTSNAEDCAFKVTAQGAKIENLKISAPNAAVDILTEGATLVKLADSYYPTVAAAIADAEENAELTLLAGTYSENIDINKNITLKGATSEVATFAARTQSSNAVTYTGKMVIGNVTTTVENVNFVKGYIDANTSGQARQLTIKNCNFDGVDKSIGYAITQRHGQSIAIENCTAKNYSTGMLYIPQSVTGITVKDVAVENVAAAFNIQYSGDGLFDNVTISEATYGLHVGNYGARTFTLKDCTADISNPIYIQNNGTATVTFAFEGNNNFGANNFALKGYGVLKLADSATVKAADGLTFAHTKGEDYEVAYENGVYSVVEKKNYVAMIGETGYASLAAAINAAQAGQTITLVAAVTEDVTVNKNVTIDGANNTYTGQMKLTANATIKNVNFDGKGNYSEKYAIVTDDAYIVNVADCTAKSYMGFLNIASNNDATTVKNVTVSEVAYGIKVDYSNDVTIENADITASSAAVLNSNYGNKTITIKDSELNILGTWTRNSTIKTNYLFAGANSIGKFIIDAAIDNFKLAAGATLTAPNDIVATTDVEGYEVTYENGAYSVVEQKNYVAKIGTKGYETFVDAYVAAKDGDTIELLADVVIPNVGKDINENDQTAMFEIAKAITIDGNGHTMKADAATASSSKHTLHIHYASGAQLKDVIIDNVGKTKNVNVYCAQNVVFDNVQIINASKGSAALTINNSTVITKTAFAALGNSTAIELGIGKDITAQNLELVVEEGTIFDLGGKSVTLTNNTAKVTTAGNAVDANGNPYFAAYDTSKLYTVAQLKSKANSLILSTFSNGLTFVADAALDFNIKVKGTLNLNGHHITIADGKTLTAGGNLTINGNGKLGVKTIDKGWYTITIEDGAYGIDVTQYCRQGYASLPDLNGYYVVGAKPTATIENLGSKIIEAEGYYVHNLMGSGDNKEAMPLQFVMQYTADQTAEEVAVSPYKEWYADFVLSFSGLSNGSFVADEETYLAGFYGETEKWEGIWAKVGITGMEITEGTRYPVMSGVGMPQDYNYICAGVQEFLCAMNISSDIVAANPDLKVTLELCLVDNSNQDAAFNALQNGSDKCNVIAVKEFTAENFKSPVVNEGTWGGIDWTLRYDGSLTIAPTKGTPTTDNSGKWTYEVGQWPEAVIYNNKGVGVDVGLWPYDRTQVKTLIIEEGVTSIGSFTAQNFTNLTGEVVIPYTVKYIGQEAFQKSTMTKLTFAPVPEGKTGEELCIAQGALKQLAVEEITFPEDRDVHLHAWLIAKCANLKHITLPATIKSINGTRHVDYYHNPNTTNGGGDNTSAIISDCPLLEDITFGSQEVRDLYYNPGWTRIDAPMVVNVGLKSYSDFSAGINAVQDGETVLLLGNVTLEDTWTIPAGKEVTLDLNGYTVSAALNGESTTNHIYAIHNYGTLTIKGNAKGAGAIKARGMYNYGKLTLESGTIDAIDGNGGYGVYNQSGSEFVMNGGTVKTSNEDGDAPTEGTDATPMRNESGSKVVINGGTIENVSNYTYAIDNQAGAEVTINGATVTSVHSTLSNYGTMTINAGTFTCDGLDGISAHALVAWDGSVTTINGGTFNGKDNNNGFNVYAAAGADVEIKGGRFENAYSGSLYGDGNIVVSGGTFFDMIDQKWCDEGYVCEESESVEGYYDVVFDPTYGKVAMIGDTYYETLAAAIAAAKANDVITFIADITEDVTINKDLTIDGAGKTFTGKMTITSNKGAVTIKNVNFDGKGYNGYAVETRGVYYLTVEDCTAKNYGYGFVQNASSTVLTTVKNVTVSDMRYGVKVDYATAVVLENVDITATSAAVLNSNYGEKTITIKNSKLNILATWKRNGTTKTTYVFEGANTVGEFMTEAGLDNFKLEVDATLTAAEGLDVTTDIAHYIVDYTDGTYRAIPDPSYIAELTLVDGEFTDYAPYAGLTVGEFTYQRYFSEYWSPMYLPFQVPVSVFAEAGLEVAYINGVRREDANNDGEFTDDEGFVMELIYIYGGNANGEGKTLKANYPYFVRCKTKGNYSLLDVKLTDFELPVASNKVYDCTTISEKFAISGNYNATSLTVGSNYYMVGADYDTGKAIWSNNFGTSALLPFRFYMQVTERDDYETPVVVSRSMGIAVRGEELPDGTTLIYDVEAEAAEDMIFDLQGRRVLETEKGRIYIKGGKKFIAQ